MPKPEMSATDSAPLPNAIPLNHAAPMSQPAHAMPPGMEGAGAAANYGPVVPLYALGKTPAVVDCPHCARRGLTVVSYKSGSATQ